MAKPLYPPVQRPTKTMLADAEKAKAAARAPYLEELMTRRLGATGEKGKQAAARQDRILDQLRISKEAGFDGSPPAFQMREFAVGKRKELVQYFNVSRDLMARLLENRVITPAQYKGARKMAEIIETFESVGLKAAGLTEAVDGGKQGSVSEIALYAAMAYREIAVAMPVDLFDLTRMAAVQNVQIAAIARMARWGGSRNTVVKNLRKGLDWLVDFYGIPLK